MVSNATANPTVIEVSESLMTEISVAWSRPAPNPPTAEPNPCTVPMNPRIGIAQIKVFTSV